MANRISVPTATRLPSGKWHVQLRLKDQLTGKTHSVSITKPTQQEAVAEAMAIKAGIVKKETSGSGMLLRDALDAYISSRQNICSPQTIAGYRKIQRNRFQKIQGMRLKDLPTRWQKAVNDESKSISPKYLQDSVFLIQSAVASYSDIRLSCTRPQVVPHEHAWLDPADIFKFQEAIKGNKYEIPLLLALSGLRKSEIVAVKWSDIDLKKNTITVHGSGVLDEHGKLVMRETNKNKTSRRTVYFIIPQLRAAVSAAPRDPQAYVYNKSDNVLTCNVNRICERNGLPVVGLHGLRHSFASLCAYMNIPEPFTQQMGGWSDASTVRKIYTHVCNQGLKSAGSLIEQFFQNAYVGAYDISNTQQPQGE